MLFRSAGDLHLGSGISNITSPKRDLGKKLGVDLNPTAATKATTAASTSQPNVPETPKSSPSTTETVKKVVSDAKKTAAEKIGVDPKTTNITNTTNSPTKLDTSAADKVKPTSSISPGKPPSEWKLEPKSSGGSTPPTQPPSGGGTGGGSGGGTPPTGSTPSPASSGPSTWSKIKDSAFGQTTGKLARGAGTVLHYAAPAFGVAQMAGVAPGEPTAVGPNFRPGGSWKPNKEWLNPTKDVAKSMS